jgi:MerR family transcriptional regulator/heat shock protein HspR
MARADEPRRPRARRAARAEKEKPLERERGVFMISVAAELAEMHPQTLRMYEARGLITPKRSPKNTRLYSQADVERLRRIQRMTSDEGLNLAGVETVLEMEAPVARMRTELARMRERLRSLSGGELVPYGAYTTQLGPERGRQGVQVPIRRRRQR